MRIRFVAIVLAMFFASGVVRAQSAPSLEVYKSPQCGCCGKWVEHMRDAGFQIQEHATNDIPAVRKKLGMPDQYGSCHTFRIGKYVFEGHIPAADVKRFLKEKPKALGLAVPSMPPGSPGMESSNPVPYETLLVKADGSTRVFARH